MFCVANLWLISIAKLTSDPVARIVNSTSLLVLNISYAPDAHLFSDSYFFLTGLIFCLDSAIILGELLLAKASSQHSKVSIVSAGLNTF